MKPTVGRTVHYLSHGSPILPDGTQVHKPECRAAIVTQVSEGFMGDEIVHLAVLNPSGMYFDDSRQDETKTVGGSWHWPEREQ